MRSQQAAAYRATGGCRAVACLAERKIRRAASSQPRDSDTIKGRDDYGGVRALNAESRSLKREETPNDLVWALRFLASSDNDFMTGQTVLIDGDSAMH